MDKKKIANKLVELRGNKSQAEVARDLEISNSAIAMYENGERIPRDDIKLKIANYYKKRIDEIFFL